MRFVTIGILIILLHLSYQSLSQKVTINRSNVSLEVIFRDIEAQSGYPFFYKVSLASQLKKTIVNLSLTNATLQEALDQALKGQPFFYQIVNKTIVIKEKKSSVKNLEGDNLSAYIDVHGRVLNEKGDPVIATITVRETNNVVSTNANGEFVLRDVDENAILMISGVNIETQELKVGGKSELLIKIITRVAAQEEITIVSNGYQRISKERFVGSFSQLDSTAYARRAGMDIISRLDGTVTGVLFDKKALGDAGIAALNKIQIRGVSTLGGNQGDVAKAPLIIVDNFPFRQDLGALNPNDVLSIVVLKDAAATSIWGAQAGNGVIVITTKRGKYNQSISVSASSNTTVQQKPDLYYYPQMSSSDFIDMEIFLFNKRKYTDVLKDKTRPAVSPVIEILSMRAEGKLSATDSATQIDALRRSDIRSDLDKYVYRPAVAQQHYLQVSGGSNIFNYIFSAGYNRSLNNIQGSKPDDQLTLNSNVGLRLVKNLEVIAGINYSQGKQRSAGFSLPPQSYPYTLLADASGAPLAVPNVYRETFLDTAGGGQLLDWKYRPLEEVRFVDRLDVARSLQLNLGISYRLTSYLNAAINYQYSLQTSDGSNFQNLEAYYTRNLINFYTNLSPLTPDLHNPVPVAGILDLSHNESTSKNLRGQLNFNKSFGRDNQIMAFIASEVSEAVSIGGNGTRFYGYNKETGAYKGSINYVQPFPVYGNLSPDPKTIPGGDIRYTDSYKRFLSFTGNISYNYKSRYTFYASARKDGSNVFGVNTNKKWKPLWSVGGSWDISKEDFYSIKWLPSLRFRASYGYSGNPGLGGGLVTIAYSNSTIYTNLPNADPSTIPDANLRWEKVRTINEAIDFNLFNNRISGSFDIFQKTSTDLISFKNISPSITGSLGLFTNTASLKGNGFELSLTSRNIQGIFNWQTNFGVSYAKTIVTRLILARSKVQDFLEYGLNAAEGRIAYGISSYRWAGLDPATGDPMGYLNKEVSKNYGALKDDSAIHQVFHGSSSPLYSGNINNSFGWKHFSLSFNITYRLDFYFRKPTINYGSLINGGQLHADYALRWKNPGDEKSTNVPSFIYPAQSDRDLFYQFAEINVVRGDNVRLQDIRLQYSWDSKGQKKMPVKSMQLFVYVNNLNMIVWRKNRSNMDPDFVGGGTFMQPVPRTWTGGININF